jgi:Rrf2 family protein
MMLSKSCEYGLRAMLYLSTHVATDGADGGHDGPSAPVHAYVSLQTVSDDLGIGPSYLTKVCQQLNEAGLLVSKRGRGGGIALAQPPDAISLYDIVVAIDGDGLFEECVLGLPGCGEAEPCPLHDHWSDERDRIRATFEKTSLAEVPDVRLTPFVESAGDVSADPST